MTSLADMTPRSAPSALGCGVITMCRMMNTGPGSSALMRPNTVLMNSHLRLKTPAGLAWWMPQPPLSFHAMTCRGRGRRKVSQYRANGSMTRTNLGHTHRATGRGHIAALLLNGSWNAISKTP